MLTPTLLRSLTLPILLFLAAFPLHGCNRHSVQPPSSPKRPTSISFYMRIVVQNHTNDFTAVLTAAPAHHNLPFSFGMIHTFDNPLTEGPLLNSTHLGRMYGWYGDVGQSALTLLLVQTARIQTSKYTGTLSFLGVDLADQADAKPVPVVGGTGDFALARGIGSFKLISTENVNHQTVSLFHYNVQLIYS